VLPRPWRALLGRVNDPLPQQPPVEPPPAVQAVEPKPPEPRPSAWSAFVTLLVAAFGVVLPTVTLVIEVSSSWCARDFFDPLPTPVHTLLVACVPAANILALIATQKRTQRLLRASVFLNGVALATGVIYSAIFAPLTPLAVIAVLVLGLGLLPLAPLLSLGMSLVMWRRLKRAHAPDVRVPGPWLGAGVALMAFLAVEARVTGTRLALQGAVHGGPELQRASLEWLRSMGSEHVLLSACYVNPQNASLLNFLLSLDAPVRTDEARTAYYRVTGRTFNSVPKPETLQGGGFARWDDSENWEQAGQLVGGRVPGLSLASSEVKGSVDGDAALAYLEWTMSFATTAEGQSEARTEVVLPPGAVVSRVTLWIDGQEREAAFASTGQVREAYEKIVRRRMDPLLVTQKTRDRIQVQCFPVVKSTPMKIKLGFTVPLVPRDEGRVATLLLPAMAERNFEIAEDFKHVVRVESRRPMTIPAGGSMERRPDGVSEWLAALSTEALTPPRTMLTVERKGAPAVAWTEDMVDGAGYVVRQQVRQAVAEAPGRVILVVEGSEAMKGALPEIAAALSSFPQGTELAVLASRDGVEELLPPGRVDAAALQRVAERVRALPAVGGQDASPALARAWGMQVPLGRTLVVWVHGPHPLEAARVEDAHWWITSRPPAEVLDVMVGWGPNRLARDLADYTTFRSVPRLGTLEEDLKRVFSSWGTAVPEFQRDRLPVAELAVSQEAWKTSSHLARLWAREEVTRLMSSRRPEDREQAITLAARHQLVTEVTGAVVLERKEQYDEAGLKPVDSGTVPGVPEPETWMLLIVASGLLLVAAWRRRRES
jgi:hypothetical protein